jgi:DNA-binding NtrC family response regulator
MVRSKLIFIVDDDPVINSLVVKRFTSKGYEVTAFESGEGCLNAIKRDPSLIILDYLFTRENRTYANGMEIFNKIKEIRPDIPVIMLSGQDNGEIVLELARKGIDDYVIKDNNLIDNLDLAIEELLSR